MTNVYFISKEEIKRRRDIRQLKMQLQPLNEDLLRQWQGLLFLIWKKRKPSLNVFTETFANWKANREKDKGKWKFWIWKF